MTIRHTSQGQAFYDFSLRFRDYIIDTVGHDRVFFASTNHPRPKQQYVTFRPINHDPIDRGFDAGRDSEDNQIWGLNYYVDMEIMVYKEFLEPESMIPVLPQDVLSAILHRVENPQIAYHWFNSHRVGHLSNSRITDMPVPLDGVNWEQRSRATMRFHLLVLDKRYDQSTAPPGDQPVPPDTPKPFDPNTDGWIQTVIFDTRDPTGIRCEDEVVSYPPRTDGLPNLNQGN